MDYDVVIVGGGPSGLTAAIYASRAGLKTLLIESLSVPGQAIMPDMVENYPGFPEGINGFDMVQRFRAQAERFGARFETEDVKKIESHEERGLAGWSLALGKKSITALSVIVACGASPKRLAVPGEERLQGKGVSYCATCDAVLYKDKEVVLIGGGDTAIEEAIFLTRFARKVMVVHRRDKLRATKVLQERALSSEKIEFLWESAVIEIFGRDKAEGVIIKNIKSEKESRVACEGIFIFVGYRPNTDFLKGLLDIDETGYIVTDEEMRTSRKGIFACGDCRQKYLRQIVTACGDGAVAEFSAQHYIDEIKGVPYR